MAPIRVGIDLAQFPIRVCGLVLTEYIRFPGTKGIKVTGSEAPDRREVVQIFRDANDVVKSFFGAKKFEAAVVVVPNGTSDGNREAIAGAGAGAGDGFNIMEIIHENTAVAAAYAEKVKPEDIKSVAIVSVTAGVLNVSTYHVYSDHVFLLKAQETHPEPIEFEAHQAQESPHSGPGELIGLVGGAVKTLMVDPLDKVFDTVKKLLSSPKLTEFPVEEVVFVGKASMSEKLKQAVKERFPAASVWSPEDIKADELAVFGAAVIAFKQLSEERRELKSPNKAGGFVPQKILRRLFPKV